MCNRNYKVETDHFIIEYDKDENGCIDKVSSLLELNYIEITGKLCKEINQKTIVKICSDIKQLHLVLGIEDGADWIRGGLASGKIVIASPLNPPRGADYYSVINTAVHEFVHLVINEINVNTPRWLNEGIACFEGQDNNKDWIKNTIKAGLEKSNIPSITDLDTGDDYETFFNRSGYQYSYTIVEFIILEFGYQELNELVRNPMNFTKILKITKNEFQDKWINYLKINY